jgi:hypothetical protein
MNAVLKPQHIETIFDYDVTESELKTILFGDVETFDEYVEFLEQDGAYADLSKLFRLRGDTNLAIKFIGMISSSELKTQFKTTPCVEAGRSFAGL